jgi:hypothetical protein
MFRKITSQKPDRFPKPVRFKTGNYLSEKLYGYLRFNPFGVKRD